MSKKKHITGTNNKICCFCNLFEDDELKYGKIYEYDGLVTHYFCLLLSSNMEQRGRDNEGILGFLKDDILKELRRGKRLVCWYCKKNGATLGCCNSKCKRAFHFPCGLNAGSLHQFFGEFRSYCISHRPKQKIKNEMENAEQTLCCICYDEVDAQDFIHTLWAPCCKKNTWFHKKCVQQLALSAGYFFKCPLCNNKQEFEQAMKENGIFIPSQDASWELVPNAFEELLYRHDQCDAAMCVCPKGRKYTSKNVKWELLLCRLCGSQGIHRECGTIKWANQNWTCGECSAVLRHTKDEDDTTSKSTSSLDDQSIEDSDTDFSVGHYSPVPPSLSPQHKYECNSPESTPDILPIKIRPGPRSFKIQQEIYVNNLMARVSDNVTNSCNKENQTLLMSESEYKTSALQKCIPSIPPTNMSEEKHLHENISDRETVVVETDDEIVIVESQAPEKESVDDKPSIHVEVTDAFVGGAEPKNSFNTDIILQTANNITKSDVKEDQNSTVNISSLIEETILETLKEDCLASQIENIVEEPVMNIKIVNVESLPPEDFDGVNHTDNVNFETSLNSQVDCVNTRYTEKASEPNVVTDWLDSRPKRKLDFVCDKDNAKDDSTNSYTNDKNKKLRQNDFGKMNTTSFTSHSVPISNTNRVFIPKGGIPLLVNSVLQDKKCYTISRKNDETRTNVLENANLLAENIETNCSLEYIHSKDSSQKQWQHQGNNITRNLQQPSFPQHVVNDAKNGKINADLPDGSHHSSITKYLNKAVISSTLPESTCSKKSSVSPKISYVWHNSNSNFEQSKRPISTHDQELINPDANKNVVPKKILLVKKTPNVSDNQLLNAQKALENVIQLQLNQTHVCANSPNNNQHTRKCCDGGAGTCPAADAKLNDADNNADATNQTTKQQPISSGSATTHNKIRKAQAQDKTQSQPSRTTIQCNNLFSHDESSACDRARMTPEYVCLRDLKFRVCGLDKIQMILYNTFSVDVDVAQPHKRNGKISSSQERYFPFSEDSENTLDDYDGELPIRDRKEVPRDDSKENEIPSEKDQSVELETSEISINLNRSQVNSRECKDNQKYSEFSMYVANTSTELMPHGKYRHVQTGGSVNINGQSNEANTDQYSSKNIIHVTNGRQYAHGRCRKALPQDVPLENLETKLNLSWISTLTKTIAKSSKFSNGANSDRQPTEVLDENASNTAFQQSRLNHEELEDAERSAMKMIQFTNFGNDLSSCKEDSQSDRRRYLVSIGLDKIENLIGHVTKPYSIRNDNCDVKLKRYANSTKDDRETITVTTSACKHVYSLKIPQASNNFKDKLAKDKIPSLVSCTDVNVNVSEEDKVIVDKNSFACKNCKCNHSSTVCKQFEKRCFLGR